jgi:hypothetical protein
MSYRRYKNSDKSLVFAEYFNSEQEVRRNGGVPTDVSFDKGAAQFDGADSVIQYEGINVTSPFSFRCIATFDAAVDVSDVISQFDGSGGALLLYVSGQLRFYSSVGGSYANITTGTGRHEIVCTYDGTTSRIYANNVEGASVSGTTPPLSQRDTFLGMRYDTTNELEGSLEFVEIYNKALTAEEVSNLYNDARYVVPNLEHEAQGDGTDLNVSVCENEDYTSFSDASRTGFRASSDGNLVQNAGMADELSLNSGDRVLVTFDIELHSGVMPNINLTKSLGGTYWSEEGTQDCTSGFNKFVFTADSTAIGVIDFWTPNGVTTDFTITNLSVQNLAVEPTSKILHVTAKDGVARNLLSGDVTGDDLLGGQNVDFTTGWGDFNTPILTPNSITSAGTSAQGVYYNGIMTVGKRYILRVKGDVVIPTPGGVQVFEVFEGFSTRRTILQQNTSGTVDVYDDFVATYDEIYLRCDNADGIIFTATEVSLIEAVPEVTNTDVEVVKDGQKLAFTCNEPGSRINCGSYFDMKGDDITILAWITPDFNKWDSTNGRIIQGRGATLLVYDSGQFMLTSGDVEYSGTVFENKETIFVAITKNAAGLGYYYLNGSRILNQLDMGNSLTVSGDIYIGNQEAGGRNAGGMIHEVQVLSGLLTPEEISQYYTATKAKYGK